MQKQHLQRFSPAQRINSSSFLRAGSHILSTKTCFVVCCHELSHKIILASINLLASVCLHQVSPTCPQTPEHRPKTLGRNHERCRNQSSGRGSNSGRASSCVSFVQHFHVSNKLNFHILFCGSLVHFCL